MKAYQAKIYVYIRPANTSIAPGPQENIKKTGSTFRRYLNAIKCYQRDELKEGLLKKCLLQADEKKIVNCNFSSKETLCKENKKKKH